MDIVWVTAGVGAFLLAAIYPLRHLRPSQKRIYVPAAIFIGAFLWGAFIAYSLSGGPLLYGAIILGLLVNASFVVKHTRVCEHCGAIVGLKRGANEVHACNPDDLLVNALSPQTEAGQFEAPPRGFKVTTAASGDLVIDYQTTGMGCLACFTSAWLAIWTVAAGYTTYDLVSHKPEDVSLSSMIMWVPLLPVAGWAAWYFFSVTTLTLSNDLLIARRRLGPIAREKRVARSAMTLIKTVKDGGQGGDSFHSWGLVVRGRKELRILSRQPQEQVLWLGRLLAKWSGLPLKDGGSPVYPKYETL